MDNRIDWKKIIEVLKKKPAGTKKTVKMGSPGSAQVTRCRLLNDFKGIHIKTKGNVITISNRAFTYKAKAKKKAA